MRSLSLPHRTTFDRLDVTAPSASDGYPSYCWTLMQSPALRCAAEQFIQHSYADQHHARIQCFMPQLFGLMDEHRIQAVVGIRHAQAQTLFLERYLDRPVEQCLSQVLEEEVNRHSLVEIGQLSTNRPGIMALLLPRLFHQLHQQGTRWLVFTATHKVRNSFRRLGLDAAVLGEASIEALSAQEQASWGHYYQHHPLVMGGRLPLVTPLKRIPNPSLKEAIA